MRFHNSSLLRDLCGYVVLGCPLCMVVGCDRSETSRPVTAAVHVASPPTSSEDSSAEKNTQAPQEESFEEDFSEEEDAGGSTIAPLVDRHGTPLPAACIKALELIDYLADRCGNNEVFNAKNCKPLDNDRVVLGISSGGFTDRNANDGSAKKFTADVVRVQLHARKGPAFKRLAHLGYLYWLPRYSRASCDIDETGSVVRLGNAYRLKFDTDHRLVMTEYIMVDGH